MPRLLGISIELIGNLWWCFITIEDREGIRDLKASGETPGLATAKALRLGGIL